MIQALFFINCGFKLHDTMIYEKNGSSFPSRRDGNRYTQIFEYMFVFSKGKPKEVHLICDKKNRWVGYTSFGKSKIRDKNGNLKEREMKQVPEFSPRNNIWRYSTGKNYSTKDKIAFQHPAIFPEQLAKDHIISWSNKGDLVFDPFAGSGTTLKMAMLNDRNYLGFEISAEYCSLINKRIGSNLSGFIHTQTSNEVCPSGHLIEIKRDANASPNLSKAQTSLNPNIKLNQINII